MTTSPAAPSSAPNRGALVVLGSTFGMLAAVNVVLAVTSAVWWPSIPASVCVLVATGLCRFAGHEALPDPAEPLAVRELADLGATSWP